VKEHEFFKEVNFDEIYSMKAEAPFKPDSTTEYKYIDPGLNNEKPEDSLYNGLSPLNVKEFDQFTLVNKQFG